MNNTKVWDYKDKNKLLDKLDNISRKLDVVDFNCKSIIDKIELMDKNNKKYQEDTNIKLQELINKNIEILKFIELKLPIYNPNKK